MGQLGYITGETIETTAHFTGDVAIVNPDAGEQADYAGIYIRSAKTARSLPTCATTATTPSYSATRCSLATRTPTASASRAAAPARAWVTTLTGAMAESESCKPAAAASTRCYTALGMTSPMGSTN